MTTPSSTLDRPPAHIDPRIRARRIEVQRGAGHRRLQRLVDVGLVLAVVVGFAAALRSPLLDVDEVRIVGNDHTASALVAERSGIRRGDQLMDVDLGDAGAGVAELPWIDDVRLHRGIDGRVVIDVTERTAVAAVAQGDDAVLVDAEGRALARRADEPALAASLVQITGIRLELSLGEFLPADADPALVVAARLAALPGLGLSLELGAEGLVGTLQEQGIHVRFGDASQLEAKVRSLRTMLEQVDLTCAAVFDLRSPGSLVLTREEGCS